jgi:pilus assembly protein Flp/PilA
MRFNLWVSALVARIHELKTQEEGQALVEYALILALVSIASIAILRTLGVDIGNILTTVDSALTGA